MALDNYVKPGHMPAEGMPMKQGNGSGAMNGPMNTNGGKHPGVTRISKHPMKSLTSRKSQQMKGGC